MPEPIRPHDHIFRRDNALGVADFLLRLSIRHGLVLDGRRHPVLPGVRAVAGAAGSAGRTRPLAGDDDLVPCFNEGENARETLTVAAAVDYPDFEIIAINDGSRDNTAEVLDKLAAEIPRPQGRSSCRKPGQGHRDQYRRAARQARTAGLHRWRRTARSPGAALDRPHFRRATSGRSPATPASETDLDARPAPGRRILLDHRADPAAQTAYGRLFTVSGVICAFRKRALEEAGWWSPRT